MFSTAAGVWSTSSSFVSVPVRAEVMGPGQSGPIHHVYDFFNFVPSLPDDVTSVFEVVLLYEVSFLMIHFLYFVSKKLLTLMVLHLLLIITSKTPAGVICPGRMNTGRLPQLPIQFSYRVEVISEIVNFVTTYDVSEYKSLKLKRSAQF